MWIIVMGLYTLISVLLLYWSMHDGAYYYVKTEWGTSVK